MYTFGALYNSIFTIW